MSAMDEDYEQDDVEEETEEAEEAETEEADSSEVAEEASDVTEEQRARKSQKNKRKKLLRREKAKKAAEASNSWTGRMASVLNPKTMVSFALGIAKTMVAPLVPAQPEVLSAEPKRKINKLQRQIKTMKKQLKEMKEVIQSNQGPIGLNSAVPVAPPVAMGFIPAAPPVFDIPAAPPVMGFIPPPPPVPAGPTVAETTLQKVARQGICLLDITSVKLKSASDRPDNSPGKKRSAGGPLISQDQLDRIKLRKTSALGEAKQERPPSTPGMIDFKEMARIQLKKVDGVNRSPGGTPFKAKEPAVPKNLAPSQIKDTLRKKLALEEVVMSHDENSQADAASFDRQANAQAATVPSKVEAAFEAPKKAQEPQETADQIPSVLITPVAPSKHVRFAAEPEPLAKDMDGFDVPPTRARAASMSAAAGRADRLPLPSSSLFAVPISPVGQTKFVSRDTAKAALAEAAQHTSAVPANDRRLSRMGLPGGPTRGPMRSRVSRQIAADMRFWARPSLDGKLSNV